MFITVREAATLLRVNRMTIYRMCATDELGAIKVGHSYRIPVVTFLEKYPSVTEDDIERIISHG